MKLLTIYNRLVYYKKYLILIYFVYKTTITIYMLFKACSPEYLSNLSYLDIGCLIDMWKHQFSPLTMNGPNDGSSGSNIGSAVPSGSESNIGSAVPSGSGSNIGARPFDSNFTDNTPSNNQSINDSSVKKVPINSLLNDPNDMTEHDRYIQKRVAIWTEKISSVTEEEIEFRMSNLFTEEEKDAFMSFVEEQKKVIQEVIERSTEEELEEMSSHGYGRGRSTRSRIMEYEKELRGHDRFSRDN